MNNSTAYILELKNVSIGYLQNKHAHVLFKEVSLKTENGKLICLIGKNGIGKSTLIKTIAAVQPPLDGNIFIDEHDVHAMDSKSLAGKISMVYTDKIETENLSVYNLISMGRFPYLSWMGLLSEKDKAFINKAITLTGIEKLKDRNVNSLSDGEKQKVMIARAIAQGTPLILLDEPTSHLDISGRLDVFITLKKLCRQENKTILLSTHQLDCALQFSDEIWLISSGQKLIKGTPKDTAITTELSREFNSENLQFDAESGVFKFF
jgi:iron complex transport system ATP-binding protein